MGLGGFWGGLGPEWACGPALSVLHRHIGVDRLLAAATWERTSGQCAGAAVELSGKLCWRVRGSTGGQMLAVVELMDKLAVVRDD